MTRTARPPEAGEWNRALVGALVLAFTVVGAAVSLRVIDFAAGRFPLGTEWFPGLFAAGGLAAAALLVHRAPPVAWFATVAAAAIAAIEVVGVVRDRQPTMPLGAWPVAIGGAVAALMIGAGIATAYAVRGPVGRALGGSSAWRVAVLLGFGAVVVSGMLTVWAGAGIPAPGIDVSAAFADGAPLRTSGRLAAGLIAIATLGGLWSDLVGPVGRALARGGGLAAFPRALADELLPTSAAMRRRGVEDERARLAAELHARVLPDLRRAAEAAEATGTPSDPLAVGLRHAVEDVEELMHGRQSVVLEEYGLVAALEWLAERTQQRRPLAVDVELEGAADDDAAAIPRPVARAAFRVAQLAVDNVVRHAEATRVVLRLTVDSTRIELAVEDDGIGIDPGRGARAGRGLADMRAAAAEIAARVRVERRERGTLVELAFDRPVKTLGGAAGPGAATPR